MSKRPLDSDGPVLPYKRRHSVPEWTLGGDTLTYNLAVERRAREIVAEDRRYILQTLLTFRENCVNVLNTAFPNGPLGTFLLPLDNIIRYLRGVLNPAAVAGASQMSLLDFNKKLKF